MSAKLIPQVSHTVHIVLTRGHGKKYQETALTLVHVSVLNREMFLFLQKCEYFHASEACFTSLSEKIFKIELLKVHPRWDFKNMNKLKGLSSVGGKKKKIVSCFTVNHAFSSSFMTESTTPLFAILSCSQKEFSGDLVWKIFK